MTGYRGHEHDHSFPSPRMSDSGGRDRGMEPIVAIQHTGRSPIRSCRGTTRCCMSPCSTRPMRSSANTRRITRACSRTPAHRQRPPRHRQATMCWYGGILRRQRPPLMPHYRPGSHKIQPWRANGRSGGRSQGRERDDRLARERRVFYPGFAACLAPCRRFRDSGNRLQKELGSQFANFGQFEPFALLTPTQYLPAPPPTLTSEAYTNDFEEVRRIGSATSTVRTGEQNANGAVVRQRRQQHHPLRDVEHRPARCRPAGELVADRHRAAVRTAERFDTRRTADRAHEQVHLRTVAAGDRDSPCR